jgi:hypothetical protein
MHELIYLERDESQESIKTTIRGEFPQAEFEDASDEVHPNRISVEIPGDGEAIDRQFFRLAVREGFALGCFSIRLHLEMGAPVWLKEELAALKGDPACPTP